MSAQAIGGGIFSEPSKKRKKDDEGGNQQKKVKSAEEKAAASRKRKATAEAGAAAGNAKEGAAATKPKKPKTGLDMIIAAIRSFKNPKGSSVIAITKYLEDNFEYTNSTGIKKALKHGLQKGRLDRKSAVSYVVVGDSGLPSPVFSYFGMLSATYYIHPISICRSCRSHD
jgi:hypothetical protein